MTERSESDDVAISLDISCCGGPAVDDLAWDSGNRNGCDRGAVSEVGSCEMKDDSVQESGGASQGIFSGVDLDEMMSHPSAMPIDLGPCVARSDRACSADGYPDGGHDHGWQAGFPMRCRCRPFKSAV